MFQKNPILIQLKKKLKLQNSFVEGIVKRKEKGFGYLEVNSNKSYFIHPNQMKKVMHGDRIIAIVSNKDKETVTPKKLIEPFLNRFVGRIYKKNNCVSIIPDNHFLNKTIPCNNIKNLNYEFQNGDWAIAKMCKHPLKDHCGFHAEIVDFIVKSKDKHAPWWVTLSRYNLEREAPNINLVGITMLDEQLDRKDLAELDFITIDSISTEDMDDALYVKELPNGNLYMIIAIADPTSYIQEGSKLDIMASERGFTNYLPGFNVPMLPRKLSDDLCSLRPNSRRPVLACSVTVTNEGHLINVDFFAAWIKSKAKLVYNDVSDWLENIGAWKPTDIKIEKQLRLLYRLYLIRNRWRKTYALLFKDRPDYRFLIGDKGDVLKIIAETRRIANHIVEESMILANVCAGKILREKLGFGIYNIHLGFDSKSIEQVIAVLANHGIIVDAKSISTLDGFKLLRRQLDSQPTQFLNNRLRRFQSFASISNKPGPHFGLGLENYATWTSPIRKFSDMINHRLLKAIILGNKISCPDNALIIKISERKRLNRIAEKDIEDWLYACYLSKFIDAEHIFTTEVIYISKNGMRVRLLDNGAIAFIPSIFIHVLRNELICNQDNGTLTARGKILYRITDIIDVFITKVCLEKRIIVARPVN
ncbi:exoribonuclease II [Candidatus Pantoea edessiphila]|uniref:Exoribonuclease 2 n=1 Tax=Candidatus Pantoea edessiphila TaxID=2044610 RepID=A0A2P5SYQ9_9GAMM|nr:exoribonuclease II [Candidatus Pantoea edessiphila]MBK4775405.1 exoribonuclease II [Pantoea sp. Edef]PPI87465.1 exoribonuclease II [Candidatus Pantoea edessiphila]